jgi:predicted kinase
MTKTAVLYAMCGLPFSGKSTLANVLAQRLRLPVVSLDSINHARGPGLDGTPISPQQWTETYDESYRRTRNLLEEGASLIYDATNFLRRERDQLRSIAAQQTCPTIIIYVTVDPAQAHQRLVSNRRQTGRHDVRDEDFWLVLNAFEAPDGENDVILYDSTKSPAAWIADELTPFVARQHS